MDRQVIAITGKIKAKERWKERKYLCSTSSPSNNQYQTKVPPPCTSSEVTIRKWI
jgi:hypothetical protein